jgi:hypothetical protein
MKKKLRSASILALTMAVLVLASSRLPADTGTCGGVPATLPFTDVAGNSFFCQIAEAYFCGLTNGTSPTTYSPSNNVSREQMAAFIVRTQDSALTRGSRRAALKQWATPTAVPLTGRTTLSGFPSLVKSDGADIWVALFGTDRVTRIRAGDGSVLGTWSGAINATGVLIARGRIYVTGDTSPSGNLYVLDPSNAPGMVSTLSSSLGNNPRGITTDGTYIWTADAGGRVSKVDPDTGATTNITGFSAPQGITFDGANLWVTNQGDNSLKKLDSNGNILQSVPVGPAPFYPIFDGSNIWVPNINGNSVTVVRARDGLVLATLTGNGLASPMQAAFDGQRILVTNLTGNNVSLWKAADLTPIGSFSTGGASPIGACSDGINFWITLSTAQLARF